MSKPLARILVVDNDPTVGADLQEMFTAVGYEVQAPIGSGPALLTDAIALAHAFRPHIVILDLRLLDDYSDETSGLQLLKPLASACCILYSSHLTAGVTREARKSGAHEWLNKADDPELLLQIINDATNRLSAHGRDWVVRWPESWQMDLLLPHIFPQTTEIEVSLLNDLLIQLFPKQQTLQIATVSGAVVTMASPSRRRSIVMKVMPDNQEPQVVKFAEADQIQEEVHNYEQYVHNRLAGHFHTRLERSVQFWDVGAALYSFLGTPLNTIWSFAHFYAEQQDRDLILKPLHHFFYDVWQRNYRDRYVLGQEQTLYDHYQACFQLEAKLARPVAAELTARLHQAQPHLPDPIAWVQTNQERSRFPAAAGAIVHGDLHGDNLFVDGGYSWAIDFERTGPNHVLRDFAEMELDLLTRLLTLPPTEPAEDYDPRFVDLVKFLVNAHFLTNDAHERYLVWVQSAAIRKAAATILGLRTIAKTVTGCQNPYEYLWALLFDALFVACMHDATAERRNRAFLVAALICDKLNQ